MVCDLCHYDAHIQSRLPVTEELKELAMLADDDELSPDRDPFLKNMLEEEYLRMVGGTEREKEELRVFVETRESELADEEGLDRVFETYLATLPAEQRPKTRSQDRRLFNDWRSSREDELTKWREELTALESQSVDGQLIYDNVLGRVIRLLRAESRDAGLLSSEHTQRVSVQGQDENYPGLASLDTEGWMTFVEVKEWAQKKQSSGLSTKPTRLQNGMGIDKAVSRWSDLLLEAAESLVLKGLLTRAQSPVTAGNKAKRYLIHTDPVHSTSGRFKYPRQLSNGLYLECGFDVKGMVKQCETLLERFGQDPAQFRVRLG